MWFLLWPLGWIERSIVWRRWLRTWKNDRGCGKCYEGFNPFWCVSSGPLHEVLTPAQWQEQRAFALYQHGQLFHIVRVADWDKEKRQCCPLPHWVEIERHGMRLRSRFPKGSVDDHADREYQMLFWHWVRTGDRRLGAILLSWYYQPISAKKSETLLVAG
ncbi:MAG: hypothetical protein HY566_01085 [Candidatus Kerfeldbacteria bacterium]|nr:hypothetical protein [Candidatus Kerfeldbacteria bacterium]